jgi:hypothetical protein
VTKKTAPLGAVFAFRRPLRCDPSAEFATAPYLSSLPSIVILPFTCHPSAKREDLLLPLQLQGWGKPTTLLSPHQQKKHLRSTKQTSPRKATFRKQSSQNISLSPRFLHNSSTTIFL